MISHKFPKMSLGIVLLLLVTSCSFSDSQSLENKITEKSTEELVAWSESGKKEWIKQASGGDSSLDAWHECLIDQAEKEYPSPTLWESDLAISMDGRGESEYLISVFAICKTRKDLGVLESMNISGWSEAEKEATRLDCNVKIGSVDDDFCICYANSISQTYPTKEEWDKELKIVNSLGSTETFERLVSACENLETGQNSNSNKPRPADPTPKYPQCVMVLAPGQSGLTINDNKRELGRADGRPGYCILPNSGGEKYYYPGR